MKKYLSYALLAFVVFYMLNSPTSAASAVHGIFGDLHHWGTQMGIFTDNLNGKQHG